MLACLVMGPISGTAEAQSYPRGYAYYGSAPYYSGPYGYRSYGARPTAPNKARAGGNSPSRATAGKPAASPKAVAANPDPTPDGPLTLVVSIRGQSLTVFSGTEKVTRVPVSTGQRGFPTPTGVFSIIQKNRTHYSNIYNNAPMPFMQRLTWSGVALHAGYLPGYPASHGCVRMPHDFARRLFTMTRMGTRVIVTQGDAAPMEFSHPQLAALIGTPAAPKLAVVAAASTGKLDGSSGTLAVSETPPAIETMSLLRKAELAVTERSAALELAKETKASADTQLANALEVMEKAREANDASRSEMAKIRASVRRAEADLEALERKHRGAPKATAGNTDSTPADDEVNPELKAARNNVEALRAELRDREETAQEIAEEFAAADVARARASIAREDTALRLRLADEALKEARRDLVKRQQPVSLFVSRKTGKLYARQGFEPLFETQVSIDDPDRPVGTHVFTAYNVNPADAAKGDVRWNVVTLPSNVSHPEPRQQVSRRGSERVSQPVVTAAPPVVSASVALERLRLPADVTAQLNGLIKTGSSLIISDQPLSRETGKGTDLIVDAR